MLTLKPSNSDSHVVWYEESVRKALILFSPFWFLYESLIWFRNVELGALQSLQDFYSLMGGSFGENLTFTEVSIFEDSDPITPNNGSSPLSNNSGFLVFSEVLEQLLCCTSSYYLPGLLVWAYFLWPGEGLRSFSYRRSLRIRFNYQRNIKLGTWPFNGIPSRG